MKWTFLIATIFINVSCVSQSRKAIDLKEFSKQWKMDSLGTNNFRNTYYYYNREVGNCLINNLSFIGYSKLQILSILGKPNSSEIIEEDKLLYLEYKIQDIENKQKKLLSIYFDRDNLVKMTLMYTPIDL